MNFGETVDVVYFAINWQELRVNELWRERLDWFSMALSNKNWHWIIFRETEDVSFLRLKVTTKSKSNFGETVHVGCICAMSKNHAMPLIARIRESIMCQTRVICNSWFPSSIVTWRVMEEGAILLMCYCCECVSE